MRKPTYLKASKKEKFAYKNILFYDCESYVPIDLKKLSIDELETMVTNNKKLIENKTYLICSIYKNQTRIYQNVAEDISCYKTDISKDFWNDALETYFTSSNDLYIMAHFAIADFLMSNGLKYIFSVGFTLESFNFKSPFFFEFSHATTKTKLYIWDSFNILTMSLDKIAKSVKMKKFDCDHHEKPTRENIKKRIEYCLQDVLILKTAIERMEKYMIENKYGSLKLTSASNSFSAFTQKFLKHEQIELHKNVKAITSERESYMGGRTECFRLGKFTETLYYLDINSMYPSEMAKKKYPVKLIYSDNCMGRLQKEKEHMIKHLYNETKKGYLITAIVKIKTDKNRYAKKTVDGCIFPVGTFWTGVCTNDYIKLYEDKEILDISLFSVYEGDFIFREFVEFFYSERKKTDDPLLDILFKIFLNALYGKFGQVQKKSIVVNSDEETGIEFGTVIDTITRKKYNVLNYLRYENISEGNSYNSFVAIAGHVTSYARELIYNYYQLLKPENIYYSDTDSIITNDEGYKIALENNLIDSKKLGKLKLEKILSSIEIRGCKDYKMYITHELINGVLTNVKEYYTNQIKILKPQIEQAMLKCDNFEFIKLTEELIYCAKKLDENIEEKIKGVGLKRGIKLNNDVYFSPRMVTIMDNLKNRKTDIHGNILVKKILKRTYKKGLLENTFIKPLEFNELDVDYFKLLAERKKEYFSQALFNKKFKKPTEDSKNENNVRTIKKREPKN